MSVLGIRFQTSALHLKQTDSAMYSKANIRQQFEALYMYVLILIEY